MAGATFTTSGDESTKVFNEYLELFDCLGYRYKYFMAPNAELDWFGTFHIRTPLRIHEFLLEKFVGKYRHANFSKAVSCSPIETSPSHMRTRYLPAQEADLIHPKNIVPELTSLKTRAESDVETEDIEMDVTPIVETATSSNRVKSVEDGCSSDDSEEYTVRRNKRMKYSSPPMSPFTYLKRLPTKKTHTTIASSDEDSTDDETNSSSKNSVRKIETNEYSGLRYIEALGNLLKNKARSMGGGFTSRFVRIRIAYRKHLVDQTTQFALIIYERHDQKFRSGRIRRMLDFSKCTEDNEGSVADDSDCLDAQPAIIRSTEDGEERETIATVETPSSAEIATALEDAAFTIQQPIQRTPTKSTPIPPGTPKRRPRSTQLNMSGVVPLFMTSTKKVTATPGTTPKLSAARSLRL